MLQLLLSAVVGRKLEGEIENEKRGDRKCSNFFFIFGLHALIHRKKFGCLTLKNYLSTF